MNLECCLVCPPSRFKFPFSDLLSLKVLPSLLKWKIVKKKHQQHLEHNSRETLLLKVTRFNHNQAFLFKNKKSLQACEYLPVAQPIQGIYRNILSMKSCKNFPKLGPKVVFSRDFQNILRSYEKPIL